MWNKGIFIVHVLSPSTANLLKLVIQLIPTGQEVTHSNAKSSPLPFDAVQTCSTDKNYHLKCLPDVGQELHAVQALPMTAL